MWAGVRRRNHFKCAKWAEPWLASYHGNSGLCLKAVVRGRLCHQDCQGKGQPYTGGRYSVHMLVSFILRWGDTQVDPSLASPGPVPQAWWLPWWFHLLVHAMLTLLWSHFNFFIASCFSLVELPGFYLKSQPISWFGCNHSDSIWRLYLFIF